MDADEVLTGRRTPLHALRMRAALVFIIASCCDVSLAAELRPLNDYRSMMWISGKVWQKPEKAPLVLERLKEMGVNTGMITGDGDPSAFVKAGMPYYVENIVGRGLCLKFNSPVTKWSDFVNEWMKSRDEASLVRPYSLDDPEWNAWAQKRMRTVLQGHKPNAPVLADIRDELSTTISANPFDYDFSPQSLAGFRVWLKAQYTDLAALNSEWETDFASWDEVRPFTTDQIKARMVTGERMPKSAPDWSKVKRLQFDPAEAAKNPTRWNFAPWCDFRSYMDTALARALDGIRKAAHEADPGVPVGIEGTQMPHAFGGYDMWKLSKSVDWMEPYDVGSSRQILGSFMPKAPFVTTVFEKDTDHAMRRLWHLLLLGDRGCVVWWSEDCVDLSKDDCPLTDKAKALAPALKEMTSPLARLFLKAEREYDPIVIHYSQASIQCAWLMESAQDGATWPRRFSSYESQHSLLSKRRQAWMRLLEDAGYSPRFVSTEQMEKNGLGDARVVVLPDSMALSEKEFDLLSKSLDASSPGRTLFGSSMPGLFDIHGRLNTTREFKPLAGLATPGISPWFAHVHPDGKGQGIFGGDIAGQLMLRKGVVEELPDGGRKDGSVPFEKMTEKERGEYPEALQGRLITDQLHTHLQPVVQVPRRACVRTHRFTLGNARLLAFERNVEYHMSEDLKQAGGNEALEKPATFEARLASKAHVYDLRAKKHLGLTDHITVNLDPWHPSLYALLKEKPARDEDVVKELLEQ